MRLLLVLSVLLAVPPAAQPDAVPDAEALLRQWSRSVQAAHERAAEISYTEETEQVIDSPFTQHRLRVWSDVLVRPDVDRPFRDVRRAEANGEPIAPIRVALLRRRLSRAIPGLPLVERAAGISLRALGDLRPAGRPTPDQLGGQDVWRIEAVSPRADMPLERATLWLTTERERPVLLQSQFVLRPPRAAPGTTVLVRTDYADFDGLPIPRQRHVEATLQQRRRIRTFTVLVTLDIAFRDIEVVQR